ncbi:MAG: hypothetical protein GX213_03905 [Clostridiaceae bacterium]|nr:hypothetical protein [Clostridiaceae bacterium]
MSQINSETDIATMEIIFNSRGPDGEEIKPVYIKDSKIIQDILSMIEEGTPLNDDDIMALIVTFRISYDFLGFFNKICSLMLLTPGKLSAPYVF